MSLRTKILEAFFFPEISRCLPVLTEVSDTWSPFGRLWGSFTSLSSHGGNREAVGLVAMLSLAKSVIRVHTGALVQNAAVSRVAAQHVCVLSDRKKRAFGVEKTYCRAQASVGDEKPT